MIKICVLLAAYNGEKYLIEQLNSLLFQKQIEVDIYISVDVSTDETKNIILKYAKKYSNIYLLPYGDKYGSAGQNFFRLIKDVDFSSYDYVAFSDQDDIWDNDKIIKGINALNKYNADCYSGNVTAFWKDGRKKEVVKNDPQVEYDYLFESAGPGCTFVMTKEFSLVLKKSLVVSGDEIKNIWLHDWYCYSFARFHGYKWFIDSESLMMYRQHENNEVGANSGIVKIINRAKVVLSEDAFKKVLSQSDFIKIESKPIQLLKDNSAKSLFLLAAMAKQCRRKKTEQYAFFIMVSLLAFKRLIYGK
ncbi:glycosyltransferase [Photobacterium iliopiscarium]|uniref:Glycosyl transferase n=1 Tax=Photobacterium iliopiscarium TaxID=56192 RepID=A0A2T3MNW1_9GAMM|nr:glycosyltransferase [Photobacterium iliopiscarium]PSV98604.1 glycosyl transferase [Photobacterium iliopiscarium]